MEAKIDKTYLYGRDLGSYQRYQEPTPQTASSISKRINNQRARFHRTRRFCLFRDKREDRMLRTYKLAH